MQFDREKAQAARAAKIEAGAHFRRNWLENENWSRLAAKRGIRLPQWWIAPSAIKLKRVCRSLAVDYDALFGLAPAKLFRLNPDVPMRIWVSLALEAAENA